MDARARCRRCARLTALAVLSLAMAVLPSMAAHAQRPFRDYPPLEGAESAAPIPPDYQVPGEFVFGRLMYPPNDMFGFGSSDWRQGESPWTIDYPLGDRNFMRILRRLTTINARSVE